MGGRAPAPPRLRAAALGALVCLLLPAAAPARTLAPSADLNERFADDPHLNPGWQFAGPWAWDGGRRKLVSSPTGDAAAFWTGGDHFTGTLTLRIKLIAGRGRKPPKARLVFARDPESGAYRYVELTAGGRGRVVLGQEGTIRGAGPGTFRRRSRGIGRSAYQTFSLSVDALGRVTVRHGKRRLFRAQAGPLAPGQIGVVALESRVAIDRVAFAASPDGEPCLECHAGQAEQAPAPNVATYWDGSWWRANRGGSSGVQYGGHGDPGGRAAVPCAGTGGCHDLRLPDPGAHRDAVLGGPDNRSENTFHLRAGFVEGQPRNPWDVQVAFDRFCFVSCHRDAGVPRHTHDINGVPAPGVVQFGTALTTPDGDATGLPIDRHLSTLAGDGRPDFAPCVACHDPHGSGSADAPRRSNYMVRGAFVSSGELCKRCHR